MNGVDMALVMVNISISVSIRATQWLYLSNIDGITRNMSSVTVIVAVVIIMVFAALSSLLLASLVQYKYSYFCVVSFSCPYFFASRNRVVFAPGIGIVLVVVLN